MEDNKKNEYYVKQYQISLRMAELEKMSKIEQKQKQLQKEERDKRILEILKNNEEIVNTRKSKILEKIEENENKVQIVHKIKEQEYIIKNEYNIIKSIDRDENIKRVTRKQDYDRIKVLRRIEDKSKHFEEFKYFEI